MNEMLIKGGTIIDGTGKAPFRADLLIEDGRIASVEQVGNPSTALRTGLPNVPTLDASNLVITPGFIDIHGHSDFTLLVDPRAVSSITQGVTTEVVGNCGHGCAPIRNKEAVKSNIYGYRADHPLDWQSVGEYLECLKQARPAVNVATLVPNGNLRLAVAGLVDRPSTSDELILMKDLLLQGLDEGAFGYSTGLEYGPEKACTEEEITELARVTRGKDGIYATHTRNRAGQASETIAEAIRTSAASKAPLQISHISSVARLSEDGRWAGRAGHRAS